MMQTSNQMSMEKTETLDKYGANNIPLIHPQRYITEVLIQSAKCDLQQTDFVRFLQM